MFHARLQDTLTAMGTPRKLDQHHWKRDTVWCTCRQELAQVFFLRTKRREGAVLQVKMSADLAGRWLRGKKKFFFFKKNHRIKIKK